MPRTVIDPASGDQVTLHQLSVRHDLYYSTVRRRYWSGLRGWNLIQMSCRWREWTGREIKLLDHHYRIGTPVKEISELLDHTVPAVKRRAQERGLVHPGRSSAQRIRNFEAAAGKPLAEIAREYRDRNLSRRDLAQAIGIERLALKRALDDALWNSWPRMTIGRIDEARRRRKAA